MLHGRQPRSLELRSYRTKGSTGPWPHGTRPPTHPPNHPLHPTDLHPSKLKRGNLPEGLRIGDKGAMGRILIAGEPGNGVVDELAPIEVGG